MKKASQGKDAELDQLRLLLKGSEGKCACVCPLRYALCVCIGVRMVVFIHAHTPVGVGMHICKYIYLRVCI